MQIRHVLPADAGPWCRMRQALWPNGSHADHASDIAAFFAGQCTEPLVVLVAQDKGGKLLGFAELSIRHSAPGCRDGEIAYLEGWFVAAARRGRGVGRALVHAAESWARERGCTEFASDTAPGNRLGEIAHEALGFERIGTNWHRKDL